ncbi:MAG: hypothetical protein Sapg2KO_33510 [Saprospiraceae bacterium]
MQMPFNQAYPAPRPGSKSLVISILFGLFIALFLWFFEPFDINNWRYEQWKLLFYGLITTLVLLVFLYVFPLLFPTFFSDQNWKLKHQLLWYGLILFVIATLNGIYTNIINAYPFSWKMYWWMINRTFALGGIPIAFIILTDFQRKVVSNNKEAAKIFPIGQYPENGEETPAHQIRTDLKEENFYLMPDSLYYATAVGNYIDLFIQEGTIIKRQTYRLSLSSFETQLESSSLVRCHRSYLVNLNKVQNITGNAQGLKLTLGNKLESVPVSRKYIPAVKAFFQNNGDLSK